MKGRVGVIALVILLVLGMVAAPAGAQQKERFGWLIADKATVTNQMDVLGTSSFAGAATYAGGVDLNGTDLTIDTDGDSILDETSDDNIRMTIGGATGLFNVLTGNLKIGNGTPDVSQDGEDLYCEGTSEFDGATRFDGAVTANSTFASTLVNAAGGSANPWDWTGTAGIMNGSDDLTVIDINLTNANHTSTGNTVQGIDIGNITGDADATETAVMVGTGWDAGLDLNGTPLVLGADGGVYVDETSDDVLALQFGAGTGYLNLLTGNLQVGNGTPGLSLNGEDAYVEGTFENDGGIQADGTLASTLVNSAGGSANPIDYTGTLGIMDGSDDFTAIDVNITNANHTGTPNTVQAIDIAGITQDGDATETAILVGAGWDYGVDMDGNILVLGADGGVYLDESADDVLDLGFGAGTGYLNLLTGNLQVGNGTPGVALNGEDAYVEGTFENDGGITADGTNDFNGLNRFGGGYGAAGCSITAAGRLACNNNLVVDGTAGITSTLTVGGATTLGADTTLTPDATGGNAGAKTELIGLPRIKYSGVGAGTNGAAGGKTIALMDDSPAGEWAAIDADVTRAEDGTYYKVGTTGLLVGVLATAAATDGIHVDSSGWASHDFTDDESVGFWLRSSKALSAGDLMLGITDSGAGETLVSVPAVATTNFWTWVEIDISAVVNASKDDVHDLSIELSAAGAAKAAFAFVVDGGWKWDATEEDALADNILQDGILGVVNAVTGIPLVEYTDYFVNYHATAADDLVWITDQSAAVLTVLYAY